ncbi:hypothetical protein, partial [Campylobacter portucalensis]|uniref:hypothetical protein n=1 Tax=Campylobacter portucalensis TaxID=2608384 RepID=UPI0018A6C7B3
TVYATNMVEYSGLNHNGDVHAKKDNQYEKVDIIRSGIKVPWFEESKLSFKDLHNQKDNAFSLMTYPLNKKDKNYNKRLLTPKQSEITLQYQTRGGNIGRGTFKGEQAFL